MHESNKFNFNPSLQTLVSVKLELSHVSQELSRTIFLRYVVIVLAGEIAFLPLCLELFDGGTSYTADMQMAQRDGLVHSVLPLGALQ